MDEHQAHLQQHLEPVGDHRGIALGEARRNRRPAARSASPVLRLRQLALEREDLPRGHQRRGLRNSSCANAAKNLGVGIGRLPGRERQLAGAQAASAEAGITGNGEADDMRGSNAGWCIASSAGGQRPRKLLPMERSAMEAVRVAPAECRP